MSSAQPLRSRNWKDLYLAALFESNKASIPRKISEAQQAITTRRTELLNGPGCDIQERQALDTALFFLHALQACQSNSGSLAA